MVCGRERRESSVDESCEAIGRDSFAARRFCSQSHILVPRLELPILVVGKHMLESHMSWEGQWLPA